MNYTNTIKRALYLEPFLSIPKLEKLLLLSHLLNIPHLQLLANLDLEVPEYLFEEYYKGLSQMQTGVPLQYITGRQSFYELDFKVTPDVLIPRAETEVLVDSAVKLTLDQNYSGIDIGTGSGCIAISLAKKYPSSEWTAVDISEDALAIARHNALVNKVSNIQFIQSDLLDRVNMKSIDLITANLPYIGQTKFSGVTESARKFEPNIALFSGQDGLDLYRKLSKQLKNQKIIFKYLLAEFADDQSQSLIQVFRKDFPDRNYQVVSDLNNKERILLIS